MFLQQVYLLFVTVLSLSTAAVIRSSQDNAQISKNSYLVPRDGGRGVWFIAGCNDVGWSQVALEPGPDGIHNKYFVLHSWLMIEGNDVDGPLKIEIAADKALQDQPDSERYNIRVLDLTPAQSAKVIAAKAGQVAYKVGTTDSVNKDFLDPDSGKGLVADAWNQDNTYRNGQSNANDYDFEENPPTLEKQRLNTCHNFLQRLVGKLSLALSPAAEALIQFSSIASGMNAAKNCRFTITKVYHEVAGSDASKNTRSVWRMNAAGEDFEPIGDANKPPATDGGNFDQMYESADLIDPSTGQPMENSDAINIDEEPLADPPAQPNGEIGPNQPAAEGETGGDDAPRAQSLGVASVAGKLQMIKTVGQNILKAAGPIGDIVGVAFVILDFVNGDWVGGAFGLAGLAIAGALAFAGPVGWVVGGVIAALFAILPGLFKAPNPPGHIANVTEVLQWKFFGDRDHTGNEQCQSQGDSSCQALYGPGTLATALGIDNFDAVVFLIQFNQGYPMSIPDMAKAFTMLDPVPPPDNDPPPVGSNPVGGGRPNPNRRSTPPATIACNNQKNWVNTKNGMQGDDPELCNHPVFKVNLPEITLPNIGQTADQVLKRIIPAPNGDCKIVVYPQDQSFPMYGMDIIGSASAIACGLNSGSTLQGTAIPVGNSTTPPVPSTSIVSVSNGSQSTNGENGAFVAAPPQKPFAPITTSQAVCIGFSNTANDLCLPAGTYQNQDGGLGFTLSDGNSISVPPGTGYSLTTSYTPQRNPDITPPTAGGGGRPNPNKRSGAGNKYTASSTDVQVKEDFMGISYPNSKGTFVIASPSDPPAVCLFTATNYDGNVACFGVGGGPLPHDITNAAQSIQLNGGANAWIYAESYNDTGGAFLNGNVEDLAQEPYGASGNFSKVVKAMWVYKG